MMLSRLLKLQWSYIVIGIFFNICNHISVALGNAPLSTTDPMIGGIGMASYSLYLLPAYMGWIKLYRALMVPAIFIFGSAGVAVHFVKYADDPSLYASFMSMIMATGINIYGIALALIALTGRFSEAMETKPEQTKSL